MNPDLFSEATAAMGVSALVVDPTMSDLLFSVSALSAEGFHVTSAETFEQARTLMARHTPDVLVTAIRLGEYNGLHLVLRGKANRPSMAAVVTCPSADSVLLAEADAMQATYVVTPTSREELVAAVLRTVFKAADHRDPTRPPFERRHEERRIASAGSSIDPDRRQSQERRRARGVPDAAAAWLGHIQPESPYR